MKKLCFIIPRAYYLFNSDAKGANDKVGGAQLQSYLLSTELAKDEHFDVHFCMADFGQEKFEIIEKVKIWNAFNFGNNIIKRTIDLFRTLKKIDPDLFIMRTADLGVAVAVFYIRFFLKKKIVYMIAADAETTHKRLKDHAGVLTAFFMRKVYKIVDFITAQTKQQSDEFDKDRKRKPNIILKNIYDPNSFTEVKEKRNTVLWVGRLDRIKNPLIFLNLAKQFPDEKFVMIAPIVRDHIKYGKIIQQKAKKIQNLKLIDFVKPSEIQDYYKKAKIYVLTSELEGFSNTMAEALMAKCPILSYNVNPDNILHEYKIGLAADKDMNKFISRFELLNSDVSMQREYGENGINYIVNNHNKETIIEQLKAMLYVV